MKKHLIIVPRWGGTPAHDWYPWISQKLDDESIFLSVKICNMPNPEVPTITEWAQYLCELLAGYQQDLSKLVIMGHSVGCQAVMHALQQLKAEEQIDSAIFVAAWWDVDKPWESIIPWINAAHDFNKIKMSAKKIRVLLSDNDPFTADYALNTSLWKSRLSAEVLLVPDAKHFNGSEEMAVFNVLTDVGQ
jgi:uncharacterized protein